MNERRGLTRSLLLAVALAVAGVALGLLAGSRVLLLEGALATVGALMSLLALRAVRAAGSDPSAGAPLGREALTALVIALQGLAYAGAVVYAAGDAVLLIAAGGREVELLVVVGYGAVSAGASALLASSLRRSAGPRELLIAEAARQWRGRALRGLVVVVVALAAAGAAALTGADVLRFADPVIVLVVCVFAALTPVRLLRTGVTDLIAATPDGAVLQETERVIDRVSGAFGLPSPSLRSTRLGARLYVEVVWVVDRGDVTIAREDEIRRATVSALRDLPFEVSAMVGVTADPALAD